MTEKGIRPLGSEFKRRLHGELSGHVVSVDREGVVVRKLSQRNYRRLTWRQLIALCSREGAR